MAAQEKYSKGLETILFRNVKSMHGGLCVAQMCNTHLASLSMYGHTLWWGVGHRACCFHVLPTITCANVHIAYGAALDSPQWAWIVVGPGAFQPEKAARAVAHI